MVLVVRLVWYAGPAVLLLALGAAAAGCSTSASSSASSDSSSASSASASPESREDAYRDDVRDLTVAHVKAGGPLEAYQRQLGDLARRHGISDWDNHLATYEGMLVSGLKGAFFSLPELAFLNIRKGSFEHVERPGPRDPVGARHAERP